MAVDPLTNRIMANIYKADKQSYLAQDPKAFMEAVIEGVKEGLDFQTIEKALRAAGGAFYLIARNPEPHFYSQHIQPRLPGNAKNQKYFLWTSSGSRVQPDLFKESQSYEDNFAKLKETGFSTRISNAPVQEQIKKGRVDLINT
ncbi:MAG TPA: hypothetical protein VHK67_01415 [Rhabdochlamydiaceae bacterium]|jgi:hypothetical protein|nr:hypothetical protein [Rhabdochlamydiaceae bacterium]